MTLLVSARGRSDGWSSILTVSFLVAILTISGLPAHAQNQNTEVIEEIIVTGIRGSLERALSIKRNADNIVDSISMEDIGKLPDENVAEALQRIPGVAIDRNKGEGRFISVRGLGPDLVKVTINGRTAPGDADVNIFSDTVSGGGRAFSFDQIQSEMIFGLEVYKTPDASLTEGGLGGTVNIRTPRPLDLNRRVITAAVTGVYDDLPDEVNPKVSALYSNVFANGRFGVTLAGSYAERAVRLDLFDITGHRIVSFPDLGVDNTFVVQNIRSFLSLEDRERINLNGTTQWRISNSWEFTGDALYTRFDIEENTYGRPSRSQQGIKTATTALVDDSTNTVVLYEAPGVSPRLDRQRRDITRENIIVGGNLEYSSDRFNVAMDVAYSRNKTDNLRKRVFYDTVQRNIPVVADFREGRTPDFSLGVDFTDSALFGLGQLRFEPVYQTDDDLQFKIDTDIVLDAGIFTQLSFGASYRDRERNRDRDRLVIQNTHFSGAANNLLSDLPTKALPVDDLLSGVGSLGSLTGPALFPDLDAAFNRFLGERRNEIAPSVFDSAEYPNGDFTVEEDIFAVYMMTKFKGGVGSIPFRGNVGVRITSTDQKAQGFRSPVRDVDIASGNIIFGDFEPIAASQSYWNILPSLNLVFDASDDVIIRFGVAKTLTRPSLQQLSPGIQDSNGSIPVITQGNPDLDPFKAWQVDLSAEWYFDDDAVLAVGGFWKKVDSFIFSVTTQTTVELPDGLLAMDPFTGSPVQLSVTAPMNGAGADIWGLEVNFQDQFDWLPAPFDGLGVQANYTYIDNNAEFLNAPLDQTFGVPGLSKYTLNAALFYEKEAFAARVAYNYRGRFLETVAGLQTNPEFVEPYSTIDASISYTFKSQYTFSIEGVNLNNQKVEKFSAIPSRLREYAETGRRFFFALRVAL